MPSTGRPAQAPSSRRPAAPGSRFALTNWRVRWRLVAIIAVPTLTAAALGSLQIYGDVSNWNASGRVQHLAELNSAVVTLSQALEDERDLSAGYAAAYPTDRTAGQGTQLGDNLLKAQNATTVAEDNVTNLASGVDVGSGYQSATVANLDTLIDALRDLGSIRHEVTTSPTPASKIIQVYTGNILDPANTFSSAVGTGANDAQLEGSVTTLGALLRTENDMSEQRGHLVRGAQFPGGDADAREPDHV